MIVKFNEIESVEIPNLNNGTGTISAKMLANNGGKLMTSVIPKGASIGNHLHTTSCEINYVVSGKGKAICNCDEEELTEGVCHFCPKGASHSIINTGSKDLVLFTVVIEEHCDSL